MRGGVVAAIGMLAVLTGCSFKSNINIRTHVYAGKTDRIEMKPDAVGVMSSVDGAVEAAVELKQSYMAAIDRLEALTNAGQIYVQEAERVIKNVSTTPEYV